MLVVGILEVPLSLASYLSANRRHSLAAYLVSAPNPNNFLLVFLVFLLAMPLARRLAGEGRSMRVLETLSVGALVLVFVGAFDSMVANAFHNRLDETNGDQVALFGLADVVAFAVTAVTFPIIYRQFWMPTRRRRRR